MKSKFAKRLAALLLTLVMSLGLLVPGAFAAGTVNDVKEKTGSNGKIVVTVYDHDPVGTGTGANTPVTGADPVDGVGINALRIGSVVELTSTDENNTVSTQVAFGLSQEICTELGLNTTSAIASDAATSTYYFAPAVVQDALKDVDQASIEEYLNSEGNKDDVIPKVTGEDQNKEAGVATFDGLDYGLYLLAKSKLPADATTDLVPFLVSVPMYVENGAPANTWQTTVYAYPKVRADEITLTKTVDDNNSNDDTYADGDIYVNAGQTLTYTVIVNIPAVEKGNNDPTEFKQFIITDTNNNQTLNLVETLKENTQSALELKLQSGTDDPLTLVGITEDEYGNLGNDEKASYDYYYTYTSNSAPNNNSVLTITFTDDGLDELNTNLYKTASGTTTRLDQTLTITYNATVATEGAFSNTLTNTAKAAYKREGMTTEADTNSSTVTLYTYGIDLTKTLSDTEDTIDANKITFELYKTYTGGNLSDRVPVQPVGNNYWVAASSATPTYTMDVNEGGKLTLYGLEPGTYYLKETATMDGYTLLDKPITIVITKDNDESVKATATINGATATDDPDGVFKLSVENTKLTAGFALPQTGGAGTLAVTAIGLGLLCVAIVLLVVYRKKGNKNS